MFNKTVRVVEGKLPDTVRREIKSFFDRIKSGSVTIQIKRYHARRSVNQNAYYWGVVIPMIMEEMGELDSQYTHNLLKEIMSPKFPWMREEGREVNGKWIDGPLKSSKDYDKAQWEELMSAVRIWASINLGINIPEPNQTEFV